MNSLAQLAAIYDEDNDVDEDKQACSSSYSCTQIVKKGKKRVREDEQGKPEAVFDPPEANKSSKIKLEIPAEVLDMFKEARDSVSSSGSVSADHQGRTRSFEHVPGNWASHVLVPCNVKPNGLLVLFHKLQFDNKSRKLPHMCCRKLLDTMYTQQTYRKLFKYFCSQHLRDKLVKVDLPDSFPNFITSLQKLWSSETSKLHICNTSDFHVSISRTVPIRHHWIEPLKQLLQSGLHGKRKFACDFSKVGIYVNDEKTRTFVALDVIIGLSKLKDLVKVVDKAFLEFDLPTYYKKPSFHGSFAWCLGDASEKISPSLRKLQAALDSYVEDNSSLVLTAQEIRFHSGNKVFRFHLT